MVLFRNVPCVSSSSSSSLPSPSVRFPYFSFITSLEVCTYGSVTSPKTSSKCPGDVASTLTGVLSACRPVIPAQVFRRVSVGEEFMAKATSSAVESQAVLLTPEMAE